MANVGNARMLVAGTGRREWHEQKRRGRLGGRRALDPVCRSLNFSAAPPTSFYRSREHNQSHRQWLPGEVITAISSTPSSTDVLAPDSESSDFEEIQEERGSSSFDSLQDNRATINSKFDLLLKLGTIDNRIALLESNHKKLEERLSSPSFSSPSSSDASQRRKRATPVALQSQIRIVHNSFDINDQFKVDELISTDHNVQVIKKIKDAIATDQFTPDLIMKGCKTYKKSLAAKDKQTTPVKRKKLLRSLKQRTYERRASAVRPGKEASYWSQVTPDMMSDEERIGDKYIRHPPSYRSEKFSRFLKKLDQRVACSGRNHARFDREDGSPREVTVPPNAKDWMVKAATVVENNNSDSDFST